MPEATTTASAGKAASAAVVHVNRGTSATAAHITSATRTHPASTTHVHSATTASGVHTAASTAATTSASAASAVRSEHRSWDQKTSGDGHD